MSPELMKSQPEKGSKDSLQNRGKNGVYASEWILIFERSVGLSPQTAG
jgi:hypothetical protein